MIRPMQPEDVAPLVEVQFATFNDLDARMGEPTREFTDEIRQRGTARISHLQRTDPEGAWVAEVEGEPVGCALALVRDGMWFLSLLIVKPGFQGKGIGRELLDAALATSTDRSWIMSTVEPAAVRRYQRAGFVLHPSYTAKGTPDRSKLPAIGRIRDYDDDRETLDTVLRAVRGAAMGPEVDYFQEHGSRVVVSPGKGFAVLRAEGTNWLAATDEATARDLLWTVFAEAPGAVEVDWLAANQQWAIDVCLDAHLTLTSGASLCLRGQPPMAPYLPCGAFG
ncbi:MAG: GNAT family N-acetyltransferase [Actinomycetota bacterium]|nr:GNAT family N-acetyltransferase [Actinomycetota bacterium]